MRHLLILLIIISGCGGPSGEKVSDQATLFTNINVVAVRGGSIDQGQNILIDSGKIKKISAQTPEIAGDITRIDGSGKFIMPGLAEMHAHIPSPETGRENIDNTLFLYLANGVTTIRGMLGHPMHLDLREEAANNEILSPRIFTASPALNGNTVTSVEEAREKVTSYKEAGYDFLKILPGLNQENFDAIVQTSRKVGIDFAGHVPVEVGIRHALESGYASVDHLDGFVDGLVPEEANVDPHENGFFGYNFTPLADTSKIDELVQLTTQNNVWVVPTQCLFERWFTPVDTKIIANEPEMKYMAQPTLDNWINSKNRLTENDNFKENQWKQFNDIRKKLIYELHKNGHGLLLGSDAPQVFDVPGFSIHHELQYMVDAGLTPLEAIKIGTFNPAKFFGMVGEFGEIKAGASADLIVVPENPLENLNTIKNNKGVMVRGKWLSREAIDEKLAEIAETGVNQ